MHRDLDHALMAELKRVLGIDKWFAEQANVPRYKQLAALFDRICAYGDLKYNPALWF
jgi:hypothetical protein